MNTLRMGVIGLGWFGEIHADVIDRLPHVELAALCTRTESRLNELAAKYDVGRTYTDYRDLLADDSIDAVSIVTMWDQHTQPTLDALEAGKHVFLEKPMASTVADCDRICAAAKSAAGKLMVGHICRFNPRYASAKREIESGAIGRVLSLTARRNIPAEWTSSILNKIGPIAGDTIHCTDIMLWLTGSRITTTYAQTLSLRNLAHPDLAQTMYRFDSGAVATAESVWCMPAGSPFDIDERMEIVGTDGVIHIQDTFPNFGVSTSAGWRAPDTTYWPSLHGVRSGALRDEFLYFADCVLNNRPIEIITPEESRAAVVAVLAAEESARTGDVVRIE